MSSLIDIDAILSENEQWLKLEEEWGKPIDLDIEEDQTSPLTPAVSTLDLKKSTFDSSFLFKKVRRKLGRQLSKKSTTSALEYEDFLHDLRMDETRESSKQFYFINGEIVSAASVDEICDKIDDIFKSIDKLASAANTIRKKEKSLPDVVNCSISASGLSFDDTVTISKERSIDNIDRCIEEALDRFNSTLASLDGVDESTIESVTTLVRKFSSVLSSPLNCSPRRQRQCCVKFKDLADFWSNRAFNESKFEGNF